MGNSSILPGQEISPYVSVLAGSFSGLMARFVTAPIDIVKIRMQLRGIHAQRYTNSFKTLASIIKYEGVTALWKGNLPAEIMYVIYGGTQFTTYSVLNSFFSQLEADHGMQIPASLHAWILGSVAGCASTTVSYPFDVLRTRLASNDTDHFNSFTKEISKTYKNEGLKGFYGGGWLSINYIAIYTGFQFGFYTHFKDITKDTPFDSFAGLMAGVCSKTIVYPVDLIRRRRQMSTTVSSTDLLKEILRKQGVRGVYHGLTPALLKAAPTTAVSFYFYELGVKWLNAAASNTFIA